MKLLLRESGAIRVRTVFEFAFLFFFVYVVVQVAPVVVLRMNFLNQLEVLANAPVTEGAAVVRRRVIETAEGLGIALVSEQLLVDRDRSKNTTVIDAQYELHINFYPSFIYVWRVHDRVEALLF